MMMEFFTEQIKDKEKKLAEKDEEIKALLAQIKELDQKRMQLTIELNQVKFKLEQMGKGSPQESDMALKTEMIINRDVEYMQNYEDGYETASVAPECDNNQLELNISMENTYGCPPNEGRPRISVSGRIRKPPMCKEYC